jgi:hypothetical protein
MSDPEIVRPIVDAAEGGRSNTGREAMKKNVGVLCALAGLLCVGVRPAQAMDVGDPVFKGDVEGAVRAEVVFENFDRDLTYDYGDIKITAGGITDVIPAGEDPTESPDEDLYVVRVSLLNWDQATLYANAGLVDEDDADGAVYLVGLGGKALLYELDDARFTGFAQVNYVPAFDVSQSESDPDLGPGRSSGEAEYYELAAGVLASAEFELTKEASVIPYAGVSLSMVQGSLDIKSEFPAAGVTMEASADLEQDEWFDAIVGATVMCQRKYLLRLESRLIGETSYSVALGTTF